ncbi:CMRF35-like molecule 5 [Salminus brasiliensis]|uniref:CMRF35-like molecule 5 n=1 Tax=Salminus brasiliensis TaxID=930266 RepID=UPI003B82C73F
MTNISIITISITIVVIPAGISAVLTFTGLKGHSVQIKCPYNSRYANSKKYLCRGECLPTGTRDIPVHSGSAAGDQRFSLEDDTTAKVFTITITNLRTEDGGKYWCVAERLYLFAPAYTEVLLQVNTGALISTADPLFVFTFTSTQVQKSPIFPTLTASVGFICASLLISGIAVGVIVLFLKRRKTRDVVISARPQTDVGGFGDGADYENDLHQSQNTTPVYQSLNPKTNRSDSIYQSINPQTIQSDSIYQSIDPNTNKSESFYKSLNVQ